VTLSVSKGPATTQVPDVTNQNQADATQLLEGAGLTVAVVQDFVTDPSQDGIVISQDPAPGADAKAGEVVTIHVGKLAPGNGSGRWALPSASNRLLHDSEPRPGNELQRLPGREVATTLADVDVVFPVLHGPFGEDGTVQGLLELAGVPYVGAGVLASALCMDKDVFKSVLRDHGIPVTENITLRLGDEPRNPFGYPCFVKPARLGSSVGITKAHDEDELRTGVALAFKHDEKVLVERFVQGTEVEVGVLGNLEPFASLPGEIVVTHNEW